ncbi:potassium channel family protein [Streptomyces sp. NPDC093225]|uniref:potassium channel family protein n=1 Tax=Streptomyces sp. NPDC093225 TaxID=3366034 RepID=UPI0038046CD5
MRTRHDAGEAPRDQGEPPSSRQIIWSTLRVIGSITALGAAYFLMPLDHFAASSCVIVLFVGLAVFVALVALQLRSILRASHPGLRAAEALSISTPFFLLLFAATYVTLAAQSSASFGGHLSHTDSLYFTVTVFSTVGFGDITAKSDAARLVVTVQMLADLIVLGLALKIFVGAVRRSRERRSTGAGDPAGETATDPR